MDTRERIIEASLLIFTEYGYLGSSTKAIAEKAGVAEMTLFRKFKSKQNLFNSMLKEKLGNELSQSQELNLNQPLTKFTKQLLHNRLLLISTNIKLVQMIIQESLQGRLSEELNFIKTMSNKFDLIFRAYFEHNKVGNKVSLSRNILAIILHYAILESDIGYDLLTREEQNKYLDGCLELIELN